MFRLRRRAGPTRVFSANLRVHRLDSIPVTNTLHFVRWDVLRASLSDPPTGRTTSRPVESGNVVRWNEDFSFEVRIPSDPADPSELQPCVLRLSIRSERRRKAGFDQHGIVEVDLADVAGVGRVSRAYLVHESLLNSTLNITVRLQLEQGDHIFRRPGRVGETPAAVARAGASPSIASSGVPSISGSIVLSGSSAVLGDHSNSELMAYGARPGSDSSVRDADGPQVVEGRVEPEDSPVAANPSGTSQDDVSLCLRRDVDPAKLHATASLPMFKSSRGDLVALEAATRRRLHGIAPVVGMDDLSLDRDVPKLGPTPLGNNISLSPTFPGRNSFTGRPSSASVPSSIGSSDGTPTLSGASGLRATPRSPEASLSVPLSPRSPSGSISAAAILEHLPPEKAQEEIYEIVRSQRVRDEIPPHIVQSRVPLVTVLNDTFELARQMLAEDAGSASRRQRSRA